MLNVIISWVMGHPLQSVAILAGVSIATGLLLVPRVHELTGHGHPRC